MTTLATGTEPRILGAEPQLYVTDMCAALAFYGEKLGFEVAFTHGTPPFSAQVVCGGARLNLRLAPRPSFDAAFLQQEIDPICATVTVEAAEALHEAWRGAGVDLHQALRREPWGAWTFIVRDPSGNLVLFAGR